MNDGHRVMLNVRLKALTGMPLRAVAVNFLRR